MTKITKILGRQVLDSRGNPTVEAEVFTENYSARAIVPSGTSTGTHEALELRDGGKEYHGQGVTKALENVTRIGKMLTGKDVTNQKEIDFMMIQLDGTDEKTVLGANAILAVSMACARVAAKEKGMELFEYLQTLTNREMCLPTPYMNIINGGMHADNALDFQEYMIVPQGKTFAESLRIGAEVYQQLKKVLKQKNLSTGVGDEGGFAPDLESYEEPIKLILEAVKELGYQGKVKIAMDIAASDFYNKGKYTVEGKELTSDELSDLYCKLIKKYPIISIEDPFDEEDFAAFAKFTKENRDKIQVVGDDLLVTNVDRIRKAMDIGACNALLLKVNQIGTLLEAIKAAELAFRNDWKVMVSHRSGETEDTFIADLAVALGTGQIKTGATCRGERTAKYNRLLRIEEKLKK